MNGCGRPRVSEQGCSHLHRRPPRQDHVHDRYLATFHASKKRGPYGCTEVTQPKSEIYRLRLTLFLLLCFFCFSSSGLRSEEHTSELQSRGHLLYRLLLEKKKGEPTRSPGGRVEFRRAIGSARTCTD